ncbi:uncharacterized protein FFB20_11259 [Fusarium fujikuroi]|nr:uncharacterized protein FFE2_08940 [Fusarium fujikuroi]SCO00571.1 uncharacterized protein FFB20_11259 [Fusarium fujikuroi]SCO07132.1 uncharacterized protein FFC1_10328 [Fusarium fujikuroi]
MAVTNVLEDSLERKSLEKSSHQPTRFFEGSMRLDLTVDPVVTFLYLLCFIDRNARIRGMEKDLDMVAYQYNIVLSIFYIVYLLVEVPSNILMKRYGPHIITDISQVPTLVIGFGFISICTAFVKSFAGLATVRAVLGILKALFVRGVFVAASALADAFGGLLPSALTRVPEWGIPSTRIYSWRHIFFLEGIFTVLFGIISIWLIPRDPETCKYLTERQKQIAAEI